LRLLHLIYDHPKNPWVGGGGAIRAYELSKRLVKRGHSVTILSGRYPGAEDYEEGLLRYRFIGSPKNYIISTFSYALNAISYVRRHSPEYDIIVEDFAPWNPVFSSLFARCPVILHVNHIEGLGILRRWLIFGIPFYIIERIYPRFFKNLTALSEWTKRKLKRPDAVILPAGIEPPPKVEPRVEPTPYIVYVGRLHIKNKGLDTLIEAVREGGQRLLIVGRGRDEETLRHMAEGLKGVEFLGFLDEAEKLSTIAGSVCLVLPSRFEGWGIVLLEAASLGRPVIVSDIPELEFAVRAGWGLSFRLGDPKDLLEKINLLMGDTSLRAEMSERAIKFSKNYLWDNISVDYENYLKGVLEKS